MPTRPMRRLPARRRPTTRIGRAVRARYAGFGAGLSSLIRRRRMGFNPTPSFVETYNGGVLNVPAGVGAGGQFAIRISDIPQIADYIALYRQYRINWVKVMLIANANGAAIDINNVVQNQVAALPFAGQGRIAWVVNDTPAQADPITEDDVLTDNGCKVRPLKSMWAASFKPRPDKFTGDAAGGAGVAVREKFNQWLSFAEGAANPLHRGIAYWATQPGGNAAVLSYNVYYKVSFSLRDPK